MLQNKESQSIMQHRNGLDVNPQKFSSLSKPNIFDIRTWILHSAQEGIPIQLWVGSKFALLN